MASNFLSFSLLFVAVYTADGFPNYVTDRCVYNSTELTDIEYIRSYIYNKLEFVRFSSSVGKFVGYTEFGIKNAEVWNSNPGYLATMRAQKETYCKTNIEVEYQAVLTKSAKPYARLQYEVPPIGKHPVVLVCSVYDFYPKQISVSWLRDGQEVTSGVSTTNAMADGDWYYQIHSYMEYTPKSKDNISCVVEHVSLKEPLVIDWDPSMPKSERDEITIGGSELILGLIIFLVGFIFYRRKAQGWILVPTK